MRKFIVRIFFEADNIAEEQFDTEVRLMDYINSFIWSNKCLYIQAENTRTKKQLPIEYDEKTEQMRWVE